MPQNSAVFNTFSILFPTRRINFFTVFLDILNLTVFTGYVDEVHFRLKMTAKLRKLKRVYSDRVGINLLTLRFLFDGRRINDHHTPRELEMEQDDVIQVVLEQGDPCK